MSEQPKSTPSDTQTIIFMIILSIVCAVILSVMASALAQPISQAKELDRSKQMMIAARMMNHQGNFLLNENDGSTVLAHYTAGGKLVSGSTPKEASNSEILELYTKRLIPLLVDSKGQLTTFKATDINESEYYSSFKKSGYYKEPYKLLYKILPNDAIEGAEANIDGAEGWVFPVNGMGLWDAIYGYLAIDADGVTVIGASWYDQKETPGLGANISEESWQSLFPGKKVFLESVSGQVDTKSAPLGIVVVKGKVSEVYGESPKAKSAVDGMAGATLTGNGVTDAYREVLEAYRPFLERVHAAFEKDNNKR